METKLRKKRLKTSLTFYGMKKNCDICTLKSGTRLFREKAAIVAVKSTTI